MKMKKLLFYLLAAILGGCVPVISLHPLYTEKDIVFEEKLLGTWVDDPNGPDTIWEFKRHQDKKNAYQFNYTITESEKPLKGIFVAHMVKLGDKLFMDVFPLSYPSGENHFEEAKWGINTGFFVPAHTFLKVNSIGPTLKLCITNVEEIEKLLKADPNAIKHETVEDSIVLTASTSELQKFVVKYADDSRVFDNEIILQRKVNKEPDEPNSIDPNNTKAPEIPQ